MNAVAFIVAIPIMTIMPLPDPDLWPLLVVSTLIHALYPFFLAEAYRSGDLSATFSAGVVPRYLSPFLRRSRLDNDQVLSARSELFSCPWQFRVSRSLGRQTAKAPSAASQLH